MDVEDDNSALVKVYDGEVSVATATDRRDLSISAVSGRRSL